MRSFELEAIKLLDYEMISVFLKHPIYIYKYIYIYIYRERERERERKREKRKRVWCKEDITSKSQAMCCCSIKMGTPAGVRLFLLTRNLDFWRLQNVPLPFDWLCLGAVAVTWFHLKRENLLQSWQDGDCVAQAAVPPFSWFSGNVVCFSRKKRSKMERIFDKMKH